MKKSLLLTLSLSCLAVAPLRADLIYYEPFNYADGQIITSGAPFWLRQNGTGNDALVHNHKLEVSSSATTGFTNAPARTDDVNRPFTTTYTNGVATNSTFYSSFTINCTNLPSSNGTYFAHFLNNATTFYGRTFLLTGNPNGPTNTFTALPGTFRIGVSGPSQGPAGAAPNKIFPVDLATNTDYQVVIGYDPVNSFATLWVNPTSSTDASKSTTDLFSSGSQNKLIAFGFRQAAGFAAFLTVSNLSTATTFDEAATNVWSTTAVPPIVVYQPKTATNFVGDVTRLFVVANGQGLGNLTYQWRKNGSDYSNPNGNSNVLDFASADIPDSGNYACVVTTPYGLSVTSAVASLLITNPPVAPIISRQPASTSVYAHSTATIKITATGPPPVTYAWFYNNSPVSSPNVSGDGSDTLTISDVQANNGTVGTYRCDVTDPFGTTPSSNAILSVLAPQLATIGFLRTLVDANYLATNSTTRYQATGTVTTATNTTSGNTSSYYIQDGTGGINIFVTGGQSFRPNQGDQVTFVGFLSSFSSTLELEGDVTDPTTSFSVVATNLPLPAPKVIPFTITNNLALSEAIEGSLIMLTNVYFTTPGVTNGTTATVTNINGDTFTLALSAQDLDVTGQILPAFAWSVIGPLTQNLANTATPRNSGYQITVTRFADIVTNAPPTVTASDTHTGSTTAVTWTAVPYSYSYSVYAATNVEGPYLPLVTGLTFTNAAGAYTDLGAGGAKKFYRVSTP